jgi:RimJ/RimL family protein N-acetyltransferase
MLAHMVADGTPAVVAGTTDDVGPVIALIGRVFDVYGLVFDPAVEVPDLLEFARHYAPPHGAFFVVRAGDQPVGSVGVERLDGASAELHRLYLDPTWWGRGVGRALVEAALAWCRAAGLHRVILWSDTRFDRAHRLYERLGFLRTGERTIEGDLNASREYGYDLTL